jgi:tRNA pseudouridine38-40 synthase
VTVYRLVIEYHGAGFSGWQKQPERRTVQGVLEAALLTILRHPTRLQGAGRTDAGVHALGQTASFETEREVAPDRLRKGLTALSRPDIAVVEAAVAPDGFNARFDAEGKHYRYAVLNRPAPSPLLGGQSFFVPVSLDSNAMAAAARLLVGEHDFSGFRSADCGRENTVRTLTAVSLTRASDLIHIDIKGTAFLKNMVRIIAGTLVDVGRGHLSVDHITSVLKSGDRTQAGQTAPAKGLTLVNVFYPKGWIRDRVQNSNRS